MSMQPGLIIPSQQRLLRVFRRLLDGLAGKIDEYFRLAPTDALDPLRRNQDLFPRPPVPCIDDEITNRPRLVIDDKILDVANLAVCGLDVIASSHRECCANGDPTPSHFARILSIFRGHARCRDKVPTCMGQPNTSAIHNTRSMSPRIAGRRACRCPRTDCPRSAFWSNRRRCIASSFIHAPPAHTGKSAPACP